MEKEKEIDILFITLALSAALHAALVWFDPAWFSLGKEPDYDVVVVEIIDDAAGKPETVVQAAGQSTDKPSGDKDEEEPKAPPPPKPVADAKTPARETAELSKPTPAPKAPVSEEDAADVEVETVEKIELTREDEPPEEGEVMEVSTTTPDPAGGRVREATVDLNETDKRYRGYLEAVRSAIHKQWIGGDAIMKVQTSGIVTVRFTLGPSGGRATGLGVLESSGQNVLDEEVYQSVNTANFPPFPAHWTLDRLHLIGEFNYAVNVVE